MKINDNIENINDYATDLIKCSREFYILIDDMYESIKKINESIDISEESSIKKLIQSILSEKNIYTNYGTCISKLGNTLLEYSVNIKNILTEKGIRGSSIVYDGDKMSNEVIQYLPDAKKYIQSARNCANEFDIDYDCGQHIIKEKVSEILNQVNEFESWNSITKNKYTSALDTLKTELKQAGIEKIKNRNSNINTI